MVCSQQLLLKDLSILFLFIIVFVPVFFTLMMMMIIIILTCIFFPCVCDLLADFVSLDDFVGDGLDEGIRHRRPVFNRVPPIRRKAEKVTNQGAFNLQ